MSEYLHVPKEADPTDSSYAYLNGFGNVLSSEALPGSLPKNQNSPQRCPYGLYAEQLSGSSFTSPRHRNLHSWLYRIRPSVLISKPFERANKVQPRLIADPQPHRWNPLDFPPSSESVDFIEVNNLFYILLDATSSFTRVPINETDLLFITMDRY
jgi:homogentisate 1,2-dioxygenase